MFTTHDIVPFLFYGGYMNKNIHRSWGRSTLFYCPKMKLVRQYDNNDNARIYRDMPSYGLERKELPHNDIVAEH